MKAKLYTSGPYCVSPDQIPIVEDAKNARYIGSSSIPNAKDGSLEKGWSNIPLDLFWQPEKHAESGEHLFGIFRREGQIFIRGANKFTGIVEGVYLPRDNILMYSCHVHDYFCAPDGMTRVCVDGGRDYLRTGFTTPEDYESVTIDLIRMEYVLNDQRHPYEYPVSRSALPLPEVE